MLPPYAWRTESLVMIFTGVVSFTLLGGVVNALVPKEGWEWVRFLVATLSFHAAAIAVVHVVMRGIGLGWRLAFGLAHGRVSRVFGVGFLAGLMVLPLAWLASWVTGEIMRLFFVEPAAQEVVSTLMETNSVWSYGVMGLMAVSVVPLAEEVLFRGMLYPFLKQHIGLEWAVAISAVGFGMIHMNLMTLPSLIFLALVLTWLYEVTGNLLAPVVAHAVFNLANLLLLLTV